MNYIRLLAFGLGYFCCLIVVPGQTRPDIQGLAAAPERMPSEAYQALWNDPVISSRIDGGIRTNRMSQVVLKFTSASGIALTNLDVQVEQTHHDFLFGANIFMLGGFPTPDENLKFEQTYTSIFNYATVPFFWSDLEPEPGKLRFTKDSPVIFRRPPPDTVVEFCQQHGLEMKGHPLVWHNWYPKWRPDDPLEAMTRVEQRIAEIAARYGGSIKRWEVVNEPCERRQWEVKWCNLPEDYVYRSFDAAAKVFPTTDRLMLNEATTYSWSEFNGIESRYYRLIRELLGRGARVEEIGFQFHIMKDGQWPQLLAGKEFTPASIFKVLDQYSDFGRPIAITELTFPTLPNTPEGERNQATVARNYYRLWFSHPRVEAISWWNLVEGTAVKGEDKWNAGLVRRDFSPKPVFTALDQLINHDWKTKFETNCVANGGVSFRGFHGDYTVTVQAGAKTVRKNFHLNKGATNEWNFPL
ncbi:MAG: endo-1,4-beta-xylanase [Verrucomicrobiota bacterium]